MTMSDHMNQPHQVPRGPTGKGLLSRSDIMGTGHGASPWTMFMPGQSKGTPDEFPTDWPRAGRLLRVPKCVFLTSCPPAHLWGKNFTLMSKWAPFGYFGHWDDSHARDTRSSTAATSETYGSLLFEGFKGGYGYIGWTIDPQYPTEWDGARKFHKCEVVRNAIYDEHYRLIAEFQAAKETLEARYPQDVFVEICEFFPNDPLTVIAPNDELSPKVFDCYTPDGFDANQPSHGANGPVWLLGPDELTYDADKHQFTANFFGTDFLHIYCGYQAEGGTSTPRTLEDTVARYHWTRRTWGYSLDRNFSPGFDQWIETQAVPGGYESFSYDQTLAHMESALGNRDASQSNVSPVGKLDNLRVGWPNFAGYRVALHEYDCVWDFPGASFLSGSGVHTRMPRGDVNYGDQDWVENTVILGYDQRKAIYEASPEHDYDDGYFPGPAGLRGDGAYNAFDRYPGTDSYVNDYVPALQRQHDLLKTEVTNLGPKTVSMWNAMNEAYGLDELGITYEGGSRTVNANSIVAFVENHYGLSGA